MQTTDLPNIGAFLPYRGQELESSHPLLSRDAGLPDKVMSVGNEFLQNEFQSFILATRVDCMDVLSNVISSKVLHLRHLFDRPLYKFADSTMPDLEEFRIASAHLV